MTRIAIIGAGLSGLVLARQLSHRAEVQLFEKSRGPGGRMATRRAAPYAFDHGAQYFTAKGDGFTKFLAPFIDDGTVAPWEADWASLAPGTRPEPQTPHHPRYVAVPGMNALSKALADDIAIGTGKQVSGLSRESDTRWRLEFADGGTAGPFDWVVSTAPAPQTEQLLPDDTAGLDTLRKVRMTGNFTLMLGYENRPPLSFQAGMVEQSAIGFIAEDSSKPGRGDACSLVVQSTNEWAEEHLEDDKAQVQARLMQELETAIDQTLPMPNHIALHRWRYAATPTPLENGCLIDHDARLAACGDWCLGGRIEAAYDSAMALAGALDERLD